jgi:cyclohexanecarboxylate-CoA ligase
MSEPLYDATTFWELVDRRAGQSPDHPMLIDDQGRRITFAEFKAWAERVAAGFLELGVREGTPVTWQLHTGMETVVVSMALSRLGAVQNPIIPIYRDREVGFLLRETGAEFFLVPGTWRSFDYEQMAVRLAKDLERPPQVVVVYDSLSEADPVILAPPPDGSPPDGVAGLAGVEQPVRWIYSTSGTTSDPKGVRHTDATLIAGGGALAVAMDQAVEILRRHGATMAGGSTAFYTAFLNEQRKHPDRPIVPTLRLLSGGGAPKPPEVFFEVKRELHIPVVHGMGMTEVPMAVMGTPHDTDEQLAYTDGKPVQGAEIRIVGDDGRPAPTGVDGELRVRGPMVCKGYTRPDVTAQAFDDDGFFRSGDLAHIRPDGHVVITGRIKDIIIRKGENIGAKEIEDLLYQHPKVAERRGHRSSRPLPRRAGVRGRGGRPRRGACGAPSVRVRGPRGAPGPATQAWSRCLHRASTPR